MYTAHYNLKRKPFQISSDAGFIWLGEKHRAALATLRYGILDNKGFLLLTGDVGTGKTTLINALIASLSNDVIYASVPDPSLEKLDFFNYIAAAFDISGDFASKGKFLSQFSKFLHQTYEKNKKVLLIIDESQLMTQQMLEEVRLLSNIVTRDSSPLLNIFFVGQYEFNEIIRRPENRAIAQRLTLNYYIEPLTFAETGEYIQHRLKIAGTREKIFNASAVKAIYEYSQGLPRKINIVCDYCLMSGYAEDKKTITDAIVKESVKDLRIPEYRRERHQENQLPGHQAEFPTTVAPEQPGERLSHPGQPARVKKAPRSRLMKVALLLVLALMSFGSLFVYSTHTTYQETVAYFAAIQEKIGLGALESIGKKMQPEPQGKTLPPDNTIQPEPLPALDIPSAVIADRPANEKEQADPAMAARNDRQTDFAEPSGTTEQDGEAVPSPVLQEPPAATENNAVAPGMAEPVAVQSLPALEDPAEKSADPMPERSLRPFSDEPLVIRFKYDSNLFSDTDIARMRDFAEIWKGQPEVIVKVSGYTDSIGDDGYNRKLSQFRANMVKSFLMGQGLPPEKISAEGLGNRNPIEENDTAEGRMMNRRVEISVDTAETNR